MARDFQRRFWLPPRAHGDIIADRRVSFLELFYDLVYVVVIARAAHTLAEDISWRNLGEFVVVFGLIWIAWLNGTMYYELHGREDGRTRFFVFIQMLLLALLAVFTAEAAGETGNEFAIVYTAFLAVLTWLWYTVRRQDTEEYLATTARYLAGMVGSVVIMAASAALPDDARMVVWALLLVGWLLGGPWLAHFSDSSFELGLSATDSMVERFGLFVIIVLGEVVVGVVLGLSEAEHNLRSITTGMLGLMIGFALWWTYFDFVGRRLPRDQGRILARWMYSHLPVTLSIAAAGAAMVSLIAHAGEPQSPIASAWLLSGSVALGMVALNATMSALRDYDRLPALYQPLSIAGLVAAGVAVLVGWWRPTPWILALALVLTLAAVWTYAIHRWLQLHHRHESDGTLDTGT